MAEGEAENIPRLAEQIAACRICRDQPARGAQDRLPHEPRPVLVLSRSARILIASQAPGLKVHETGLPFNDASGNRLRDWMGVSREEFYNPALLAIAPMGFCFPGYDAHGGDLPPRRECALRWRTEVMAAMPQIELILAIGQYAQSFHLRDRRQKTMTETVSCWRAYLGSNEGPAIMPLPHPSWRNTGWLKKNPWFEADLLPVLKTLVRDKIG
jgi:uracil-DNA glycosylase